MFTIVIQQKNNIQTSQINFNFIQRTCQQEHVWILGPCSQAHHDRSNKEERCEKVSSQYPWKHFNATIYYDKSWIVKESEWNVYLWSRSTLCACAYLKLDLARWLKKSVWICDQKQDCTIFELPATMNYLITLCKYEPLDIMVGFWKSEVSGQIERLSLWTTYAIIIWSHFITMDNW